MVITQTDNRYWSLPKDYTSQQYGVDIVDRFRISSCSIHSGHLGIPVFNQWTLTTNGIPINFQFNQLASDGVNIVVAGGGNPVLTGSPGGIVKMPVANLTNGNNNSWAFNFGAGFNIMTKCVFAPSFGVNTFLALSDGTGGSWVYRTDDGGVNWINITPSVSGGDTFVDMCYVVGHGVVIVGGNEKIWFYDGSSVSLKYNGGGQPITVVRPISNNSSVCIAGGTFGFYYISHDCVNWVRVSLPGITINDFAIDTNGQFIYAGGLNGSNQSIGYYLISNNFVSGVWSLVSGSTVPNMTNFTPSYVAGGKIPNGLPIMAVSGNTIVGPGQGVGTATVSINSGMTWATKSLGAGPAANQTCLVVAYLPGGFYASGVGATPYGGNYWSAISYSPDGVNWTLETSIENGGSTNQYTFFQFIAFPYQPGLYTLMAYGQAPSNTGGGLVMLNTYPQ